jgi:hypothetical protein
MKTQVIIKLAILIASMLVLISNTLHSNFLAEAQTSNTAGANITLPELYTKSLSQNYPSIDNNKTCQMY